MVVAALSMIAYGHKVTSDDDDLVTQMERVGVFTSELGNAGATIIDFFPFRTYVLTSHCHNLIEHYRS